MDRASLPAASFGLVAAASLWLILSLQAPIPVSGFGIVRTADGAVVVADADIAWYDSTSHSFTLTEECAARLKAGRYLEGSFSLALGGGNILNGIFVPPFVSRSYPSSQVVIMYPSLDGGYGVMKVQMGYPWDDPVEPDPMGDGRIADYFASTGRLRP